MCEVIVWKGGNCDIGKILSWLALIGRHDRRFFTRSAERGVKRDMVAATPFDSELDSSPQCGTCSSTGACCMCFATGRSLLANARSQHLVESVERATDLVLCD